MCGLWQPQAAMAASITASSCFSAALYLLVPWLAAAARVALGAASSVPAPRLVEASRVTVVHTCLLASLCCFGFDLKIVNMDEEFQVELILLKLNYFKKQRSFSSFLLYLR